MDNKLIRALLLWFLGFIGSYIINHSSYKVEGYTSRTWLCFFLPFWALIEFVGVLIYDPAKGDAPLGFVKD